MFLLQFLELIVEDFNFWPTDVLIDILIRVLTNETIERVASFAYGNGVPLRLLSRFLRLCGRDRSEVSFTHLFSLYHMWKVESSALHQASYYNVKHKRFCWINGEDHNQNEYVLNGGEAAASEAVPLGFDGTDYEETIIERLNSIQYEEYVFDLFQ